ncbi:speriolin [Pipistrellus kuhlii]|uniref:speriolin n=1 Tax=Pipistrellus kuhlii TaxID=59472 RepID=UPI001E270E2B|nr:speriolin [Pipistrellus kuhlii]
MSLLTNYEGLRHQIERLVRENEELKKLVRLIRENQELKSAIRMQAGALGISGFSSGVGEAPPGAPQRQGAFLPQAPAAANDPAAEEVGVSGLPSTADILNSPQLSPTAVSMLLPSLGPMTQSSALTNLLGSPLGNHLTSPLAVSVPSLIASALGLPSTGSLSPHSGSMMVPPGGTPTSSLGLPTGSLTPHGGSMMVPLGGTPTGSLDLPTTGSLASSSPLVGPQFTSTTAPPGVSQSLLANPMTNEAPRVRLAEPLQGSTSGPHPSPGTTGPAATGKSKWWVRGAGVSLPGRSLVPPRPYPPPLLSAPPCQPVPLSTEHPQPSQDPESFSVTFVGGPIMTSTPVGAVGTPGSATTFSFGTSEIQTQAGAPRGQAAAGLVPTSPALCPILPHTPDPAPPAATAHSPSNTVHMAQGATHSATQVNHSNTRPAPTSHTPPRTTSSPASVNGPRCSETSRKSNLELERKLAHRKISKFPETPRGRCCPRVDSGLGAPGHPRRPLQVPAWAIDHATAHPLHPLPFPEPKQLALERLVGEIAFQLDRRILSSIFPERVRLYGFTVSNIPEKIIQASLNPNDHKLDEELCQTLTQRYVSIMNRLQSLGYNGRVHPALTEQLVNAYGILRERPELAVSEGGSYTVDFLQRVLVETVHPSMLTDALLLLSCLSQLAHDDGKPMFIW